MRTRTSGRRKKNGRHDVEELNLLPMMSLFVALVPTLLYSAVFVPVSAIGLDFPGTGGAAAESPLALAVRVADDHFTIEGVPDSTYAPIPRTDEAAARAELGAELEGLRARFPGSKGAILVVSPQVPYRDVVTTMDQVRDAGFGNSTLLGASVGDAAPEGAGNGAVR
jgi:biopolymer transport protein ExbD